MGLGEEERWIEVVGRVVLRGWCGVAGTNSPAVFSSISRSREAGSEGLVDGREGVTLLPSDEALTMGLLEKGAAP